MINPECFSEYNHFLKLLRKKVSPGLLGRLVNKLLASIVPVQTWGPKEAV